MDAIGMRDSGLGTRNLTPFPNPESRVPDRMDGVAKEFEAVFIAQMLAPLFSSVATPAIAGGGRSEEFFNALLQESYAKAMAERGGFGLADDVRASLIHLQGAGEPAARSEP